MAEPPEKSIEDAHAHGVGAAVSAADVEAWFVREVLPLETTLMQFLSHNWRNEADIADIRQDVYEQVCEAAQVRLPENTRAFVFRTARNLIIDRFRHEQVVSIETVPDLEAFEIAADLPSPERSAVARSELRRVEAAVDSLPPRCREAVVLGRIEGLSAREIAVRMGVSEQAVSKHLKRGIRALADLLYGDPSSRRSSP
jgi:RNA polymerase sigma-70 factor (ECF subfamily)